MKKFIDQKEWWEVRELLPNADNKYPAKPDYRMSVRQCVKSNKRVAIVELRALRKRLPMRRFFLCKTLERTIFTPTKT